MSLYGYIYFIWGHVCTTFYTPVHCSRYQNLVHCTSRILEILLCFMFLYLLTDVGCVVALMMIYERLRHFDDVMP
jgi:hypothetical protein